MGSLNGLKILDFSTLLPGPYATMMLGDLGAEVLRVTGRNKPDIALALPPQVPGTELTTTAAWLGRNKKNMFLNLKTPEAIAIVHALVKEYDIVVEQFRPGVMDRLGIGYEALKKINPRLIYCSLTGYGQTGPMKMNAGHDINYLARSGNMAHAGRVNTGPVLTNIQIADIAVGSLNSVVGILAAVNYRNTTGIGQFVDVAMLDGLIPFNGFEGAKFLVSEQEPKREGQWLNGGSLYDFYETKDGKHISVGALEPQFFKNFCEGIGCPELIAGTVMPENALEVKEKVRSAIKGKTRDQWMEIFQGVDACVEPVLSLSEAFSDEHVKMREMIVEVELPLENGKKVKQMGNPIKLSKCPIEYKHGAYPLGYHTKEVLQTLGYSEEKIQELEESGAL